MCGLAGLVSRAWHVHVRRTGWSCLVARMGGLAGLVSRAWHVQVRCMWGLTGPVGCAGHVRVRSTDLAGGQQADCAWQGLVWHAARCTHAWLGRLCARMAWLAARMAWLAASLACAHDLVGLAGRALAGPSHLNAWSDWPDWPGWPGWLVGRATCMVCLAGMCWTWAGAAC
ncbi:hypothetical protein CIPAW_15G100100 [Carya illinoinensis]|uniref:Uncharacterized protein n=1 Tax=Carya illinoinensis TaxID=32201 RepID=A0A8T1NDP5_CARIL|nr:hypothetical protein CIPAW_15G100000 [Carya illinoinensis]KAG6627087.1 hypothetical protein CIPAW_15G100100 [Carya illinoinensis]